MKKYLNQLLVIAALIIVGCSDPCKDVVCGPGTCDDGTCICPDGYEGTSCEILENEKYFGQYNVTEIECSIEFVPLLERVKIEADSAGGPFDVTVLISGEGFNNTSLKGTLNNGKIDAKIDLGGGLAWIITGDFTEVNTFVGVLNTEFYTCNFTMTL